MGDLPNIEFQSEFKKRLHADGFALSFEVPTIWQIIATCDKEILKLVLGDTGNQLKQLVEIIDLDHPDLISIFDGKLKNDELFVQECVEILKLAELAKENNLETILSRFGRTITEDSKSTIRFIDLAARNKMNVRFIKDQHERNELRLQKRMQYIDLRNLYKKGKNFWDSIPNNFFKFLRFDDAYTEDLIAAEKKAKQYDELGCTSLAEEIKKTIASFRTNIQQSYFGFNRITMTNASAILAKSLKYKLLSFCNNWDSFNRENHAAIEKNIFTDVMNFSFVDESLKSKFLPTKDECFFYEPRVYPFHLLQELASEETKQILSFLENFPEANGKPIFDHFGIIVPGLKYFEDKGKKQDYSLIDENGFIFNFLKIEDVTYWLDKTLLQKKYFSAIIIAEKDGKSYFICYFN